MAQRVGAHGNHRSGNDPAGLGDRHRLGSCPSPSRPAAALLPGSPCNPARGQNAARPPRTTASGSFCPRSSSWPPSRAGALAWRPSAGSPGSPSGSLASLAVALARAGARGLRAGAYSPVRAVLLQLADRRSARRLAPGLRADLLVRRLQPGDPGRAEPPASPWRHGRAAQQADQSSHLSRAAESGRLAWRYQDGNQSRRAAARPVSLRLDADPGFQGIGLLPAALRDAPVVRP